MRPALPLIQLQPAKLSECQTSADSLFVLRRVAGLVVNVFQRQLDAIIFRRPVAEIDDAAAFGAKRAVGIILPRRRRPANRTLNHSTLLIHCEHDTPNARRVAWGGMKRDA